MGTVRDLQQAPPDVECFKCDVTSAESLLVLQEQLRDRRWSRGRGVWEVVQGKWCVGGGAGGFKVAFELDA